MPGLFLCLTMLGCDRVFYYPDRRDRGNPADKRLAFEDVTFVAEDGVRLHGWFMPAHGPARGTVLHVHGNAANISAHWEFVDWLPAAGYHVFEFDYRGFGKSEGRITREGTLRDARAALDYVRSRPDVDQGRVVLFGQSIGGAVATVLTVERKGQVRALAIDSTFSGYRRIATYHVTHNPVLLLLGWWFPLFVEHGMDPIDCIAQVSPTPLLVMHGKQDRIAPWKMGQELFDAAREPKELWLTEDTDHMEVWWAREDEAREKLRLFFDRALSTPSRATQTPG